MNKKIIAGNWKMNKTIKEAQELAMAVKSNLGKSNKCDVVLCVPFTAIEPVKRAVYSSPIHVGAQNIAWADKGAFTGEISANMLIDAGATYAIIGHSERRSIFLETDETVKKRTRQALDNDIIPIVCVGETLEQRESNQTEQVLRGQIEGGLRDLTAQEIEKCIIAYEPVWAIGTGLTATSEQADSTIAFIRTCLDRLNAVGKKVRIVYGGSMNAKNAAELLAMPNIDGGLIGGASLIADDFLAIINSVK